MRIDPRIVLNFVLFQAAWFACVLGGANDRTMAGALVVTAVIGLHLILARRPRQEALLVAVTALDGTMWDSAVVALGLMSYASGNFAPGLAPYWIIAMWALFATSLNLSMAWAKGRPWLAALVGAFGGPLAYLAAERLGALQMFSPVLALAAQALGWSVLLPLLAWVATRLNGFGPDPARTWSRTAQEVRGDV